MITKTQFDASVNLTQKCLDGCYITIGKLISERDCTEAEANQRIEEQKLLIQYYKGYSEALKYIRLYSPEFSVVDEGKKP